MYKSLWLVLAAVATSSLLSGCAPVAVGAAGAVVADEVMEQEKGGDGLF